MLSIRDFIAAKDQQVAAKVMDGEAIVINLSTGIYYSLGGSGGFIWSLIEKRACLQDVVRCVVEHYEVGEAEAERDVLRLSTDLCNEGLAVASAVGSACSALAGPAGARLAYETPAIEKYTDMAEMFALDPPLPGLSQASTGTDGR
jgi:hypothetical protein